MFKKVAIFDLGEKANLNLDYLSKKLNSLQKYFLFYVEDSITNQALGEPDIDDVIYSHHKLFSFMKGHNNIRADFIVAITYNKITHSEESVNKSLKEYFSISDFDRYSVISVNPKVISFNPTSKNYYQYVAFLIVCELLLNLLKKNIAHTKVNFCLFDDCDDREEFGHIINKGIICDSCKAELASVLSEKSRKDVENILKWCSKNSFTFAFENAIQKPLSTLFLGLALGWFAKTFIRAEYYLLIFLIGFSPFLYFFLIHLFKKNRK